MGVCRSCCVFLSICNTRVSPASPIVSPEHGQQYKKVEPTRLYEWQSRSAELAMHRPTFLHMQHRVNAAVPTRWSGGFVLLFSHVIHHLQEGDRRKRKEKSPVSHVHVNGNVNANVHTCIHVHDRAAISCRNPDATVPNVVHTCLLQHYRPLYDILGAIQVVSKLRGSHAWVRPQTTGPCWNLIHFMTSSRL